MAQLPFVYSPHISFKSKCSKMKDAVQHLCRSLQLDAGRPSPAGTHQWLQWIGLSHITHLATFKNGYHLSWCFVMVLSYWEPEYLIIRRKLELKHYTNCNDFTFPSYFFCYLPKVLYRCSSVCSQCSETVTHGSVSGHNSVTNKTGAT